MKQIKLTFILTVLMSMVGLQAFAGFDTSTKIQVGDLYYYLDIDNLQAQVTSMQSGKYAGDIVIPSSINYEAKTYSVTSIGDCAFMYCFGLTSITIPNSVTSIGYKAFDGDGEGNGSGCLTSVTIPNSVTSIGSEAFRGCSGITSMKVESGNTKYDSRGNCNAIIETASNKLINGCKSTVIPEGVTSIGDYAFSDHSGLTSVIIPNSVTSIGVSAFRECKGLTSVTIPNSVTSIGVSAFYNCSGLTSITIPNSVTSIGSQAFYKCSGLTSITIPNSVTSIGGSTFQNCSGLTSVTIPNGVTSIGGSAFSGCSGLTSITIPNSVTSISSGAFCRCSGLTNMKVESGNTKYDSRDNCNAIVETASNTLLYGCRNTVIPNSVTSIGQWSFEYCSGLTSITIPNSVTSINSEAFKGCSDLKDVYCYSTEVPETNSQAFKDVTTNNVALHVLFSSSNKYREHVVWGQFKFSSFLDVVSFTYSVAGLSKLKMLVPVSEHKLNITAEEGWKVVALTVNDESKMSELKDHVLTINISADTEVKVTFGWADEANLYTEDPVTGIATIEGEGVKVQAKDGQIWVDGAAGKTVRLYTVGGALMTTVTPKADMTGKFSVAAGTYIVQVGNKAAKVVVK